MSQQLLSRRDEVNIMEEIREIMIPSGAYTPIPTEDSAVLCVQKILFGKEAISPGAWVEMLRFVINRANKYQHFVRIYAMKYDNGLGGWVGTYWMSLPWSQELETSYSKFRDISLFFSVRQDTISTTNVNLSGSVQSSVVNGQVRILDSFTGGIPAESPIELTSRAVRTSWVRLDLPLFEGVVGVSPVLKNPTFRPTTPDTDISTQGFAAYLIDGDDGLNQGYLRPSIAGTFTSTVWSLTGQPFLDLLRPAFGTVHIKVRLPFNLTGAAGNWRLLFSLNTRYTYYDPATPVHTSSSVDSTYRQYVTSSANPESVVFEWDVVFNQIEDLEGLYITCFNDSAGALVANFGTSFGRPLGGMISVFMHDYTDSAASALNVIDVTEFGSTPLEVSAMCNMQVIPLPSLITEIKPATRWDFSSQFAQLLEAQIALKLPFTYTRAEFAALKGKSDSMMSRSNIGYAAAGLYDELRNAKLVPDEVASTYERVFRTPIKVGASLLGGIGSAVSRNPIPAIVGDLVAYNAAPPQAPQWIPTYRKSEWECAGPSETLPPIVDAELESRFKSILIEASEDVERELTKGNGVKRGKVHRQRHNISEAVDAAFQVKEKQYFLALFVGKNYNEILRWLACYKGVNMKQWNVRGNTSTIVLYYVMTPSQPTKSPEFDPVLLQPMNQKYSCSGNTKKVLVGLKGALSRPDKLDEWTCTPPMQGFEAADSEVADLGWAPQETVIHKPGKFFTLPNGEVKSERELAAMQTTHLAQLNIRVGNIPYACSSADWDTQETVTHKTQVFSLDEASPELPGLAPARQVDPAMTWEEGERIVVANAGFAIPEIATGRFAKHRINMLDANMAAVLAVTKSQNAMFTNIMTSTRPIRSMYSPGQYRETVYKKVSVNLFVDARMEVDSETLDAWNETFKFRSHAGNTKAMYVSAEVEFEAGTTMMSAGLAVLLSLCAFYVSHMYVSAGVKTSALGGFVLRPVGQAFSKVTLALKTNHPLIIYPTENEEANLVPYIENKRLCSLTRLNMNAFTGYDAFVVNSWGDVTKLLVAFKAGAKTLQSVQQQEKARAVLGKHIKEVEVEGKSNPVQTIQPSWLVGLRKNSLEAAYYVARGYPQIPANIAAKVQKALQLETPEARLAATRKFLETMTIEEFNDDTKYWLSMTQALATMKMKAKNDLITSDPFGDKKKLIGNKEEGYKEVVGRPDPQASLNLVAENVNYLSVQEYKSLTRDAETKTFDAVRTKIMNIKKNKEDQRLAGQKALTSW